MIQAADMPILASPHIIISEKAAMFACLQISANIFHFAHVHYKFHLSHSDFIDKRASIKHAKFTVQLSLLNSLHSPVTEIQSNQCTNSTQFTSARKFILLLNLILPIQKSGLRPQIIPLISVFPKHLNFIYFHGNY
jgi:hypothetical protein